MKALSVFFLFAAMMAVACSGTGKKAAPSGEVKAVEIAISGMTCTGCEQTIQAGISGVEGVKTVTASHTDGKAIVTFSGSDSDTALFRTAITDKGYVVTAISFAAVPDSLK
jgi:copper chaperone CopZ